MKKLKLLFLFVWISLVGFAQSLQQDIPSDPSVKIGVLPNGLTYYIKHNEYPKNIVELRLAVNAGSILETDEQQGLAHFMEHMNFNGTKKFPKNELVSFLQSLGIEFGADLNAYTSFDRTIYMLPIPTDKEGNFDKGLDVIEDWAFNATLDGDEIDKERGVILEEKLLRTSANSRMWYRWLPKVYAGSKYAHRLPIGTEDVLKNFNHELLRQFHKDWYRPNLMAVIITGDIPVDIAEKAIIDRFSGYANPVNAPERTLFDVPPHNERIIAVESDGEATYTSVNISYIEKEKAKRTVTVGDYRDNIIDELFSEMINNRYEEITNSKNPPFSMAYSNRGDSFSRGRKEFECFAITKPEQLHEAIKVLLQENVRVQQHGFVNSELDRAKSDVLSRIDNLYNNRNKIESSQRVEEYINHYLNAEPMPSMEWVYEQYKLLLPTISLDEVSTRINTYLHNEPSIVVTSQENKISESEIAQIFDTVTLSKLEPYKVDDKKLTLLKAIPDEIKIKKIKQDKKSKIVHITLKNGAKVLLMKTNLKDDEILFKAFSYGGASLLNDETYQKTRFAFNGLTQAGVNGLTINDMNKVLSGKNVSVNPSISGYDELLNGKSSLKDTETLFQLIYSYFTGLNKDQQAFDTYVQKTRTFYDNLQNNPDYYFMNEWNKFLNQNNPRFANTFPSVRDWENTNYDLAYQVYQERFTHPGDFTFLFVGSFDDKKMKNYIETYLASLTEPSKVKENYKILPNNPIEQGQTKIYYKGKEDKTMVNLHYQTPTTYNGTENLRFKMLSEVLNIKLLEILREQEGGVYSVSSNAGISRIAPQFATFTVRIPTSADKYEQMITLAQQEIQKLVDFGPSETDVKKVQETLINNLKEESQNNNYWLNQLYRSEFFKSKMPSVAQAEAEIKAIKPIEIQEVAKKYLTTKPNIGILLPEPKN